VTVANLIVLFNVLWLAALVLSLVGFVMYKLNKVAEQTDR
jgi:hypothetical protein